MSPHLVWRHQAFSDNIGSFCKSDFSNGNRARKTKEAPYCHFRWKIPMKL